MNLSPIFAFSAHIFIIFLCNANFALSNFYAVRYTTVVDWACQNHMPVGTWFYFTHNYSTKVTFWDFILITHICSKFLLIKAWWLVLNYAFHNMFLIRYKMCKICLCMVQLSPELQVFIISLMLIECQCHWITFCSSTKVCCHKSEFSLLRCFSGCCIIHSKHLDQLKYNFYSPFCEVKLVGNKFLVTLIEYS